MKPDDWKYTGSGGIWAKSHDGGVKASVFPAGQKHYAKGDKYVLYVKRSGRVYTRYFKTEEAAIKSAERSLALQG